MRLVVALPLSALALAACTTGGGSESASPVAVDGRVVAAPACPVEVEGSPCPPRPVEGAEVAAEQGGVVLDSTISARDGSFELSLPPGTYTVTATVATGFRAHVAVQVRVPLPTTTSPLTLTVDSGIR